MESVHHTPTKWVTSLLKRGGGDPTFEVAEAAIEKCATLSQFAYNSDKCLISPDYQMR